MVDMETTTETTTETWRSPDGVPCYLTAVPFDEPEPTEDGDVWEWFPEFPGARPPVRYNVVAVSDGRVVEDRTVFPNEPWSPYDAISDLLLRDGWTPPPPTEEELAVCEHGLSASLCAGPNHYPDDRNDW